MGIFVLAVSSDIFRVKCMMQSVPQLKCVRIASSPSGGFVFYLGRILLRRIVSIVCYSTHCFVASGYLENTDEFKLSIDNVGDNDCLNFCAEIQKQFMN